MSNDDGKMALNLDEVLGLSRPVKVITGEREYELKRPEAFGPRETVRIGGLRRRINAMTYLDDLSPEQGEQLEALLDELLAIFCEEFPARELDFATKMRVLAFYTEETAKNALRAAVRPTGARQSVN